MSFPPTCTGTLGPMMASPPMMSAIMKMVTDGLNVDEDNAPLGTAFASIRPAATMIVCGLIRPEMLIEVEVTALKSKT